MYNQQAAEALSLNSISQTWETQIGIGPTAPLHEGKKHLPGSHWHRDQGRKNVIDMFS